MCGIAGFIGKGDENTIKRMTDSVSYRGPDDSGYFFEKNVGLGHRRLAIIDVSPNGHQPMWDTQREVGIVFNGEIYNFAILREELEKKGERFVGNSDTEVIIHAYRMWGKSCFIKFEGMFALAIYDTRTREIILARDKFGEKPLYVAQWGGTIVFGSEPKVLFAHEEAQVLLDDSAVFSYFAYDAVPHEKTIYNGVKKVLPGNYVVIEDGNMQNPVAYFKIVIPETVAISKQEAVNELDRLLDKSVRERMKSDVPLGIFLSGGLDSSTVAYYAQKNSSRPIETFSIGFLEKSYDESSYAQVVSRSIGSTHHEEIVSAQSAALHAKELYAMLDEPFADPSIIPTHILSRMTKKYVTVALGGDGSDEVFLGYQTFLAHQYAELFKKIPTQVAASLQKLVKYAPVSGKYFSTGFKLQRFMKGVHLPLLERDLAWRGSWCPQQLLQVGVGGEYKNIIPAPEQDILKKLSRWYLEQYLPDDILFKVDRASMLCGLEVRAPFLDSELVKWGLSLPNSLKLKGSKEKWVLRETMRGKLPDSILSRKKKGFAIPVADWLRGVFREECERVFDKKYIEKQGLFNATYIQIMWRAHRDRKSDFRKELWSLLVFMWWKEKHIP